MTVSTTNLQRRSRRVRCARRLVALAFIFTLADVLSGCAALNLGQKSRMDPIFYGKIPSASHTEATSGDQEKSTQQGSPSPQSAHDKGNGTAVPAPHLIHPISGGDTKTPTRVHAESGSPHANDRPIVVFDNNGSDASSASGDASGNAQTATH